MSLSVLCLVFMETIRFNLTQSLTQNDSYILNMYSILLFFFNNNWFENYFDDLVTKEGKNPRQIV